MSAGQSDAERANAWARAITPEITAEALGQLRANGLDGWISVFALGYAAGEAAQADSGIWLSNEEAALVMDYMAWDREVLEPIRAKLEPSWTKHHHIGEAPDPAALAPKKADPAP